jgi:cytidylate kinase
LNEMKGKIICIDGPAGSGKSTTAKLVAQKLGFLYLDTGAMYRAITWKALQKRIDLENEEELEKLALNSKIIFKKVEGENKIFLDGEDVSQEIRKPEVDQNVSLVSKHPKVRKVLVELQRGIGEKENLVAEGRDTTTVVFPKADLKIYLDCDLEERAKRRAKEQEEKGFSVSFEKGKENLKERDRIDSTRQVSPLKKDKNAWVIDTTNLTIEEQAEKVMKLAFERIEKI